MFLVTISTVAGFFMTVYVFFKTKSISQILKIRKSKEKYNSLRKRYAERFQGYTDSITGDNDYGSILINSILTDFNRLRQIDEAFEDKKEKRIIKSQIKILEKSKITKDDYKKITNNLSYFIARFSEEENLDV